MTQILIRDVTEADFDSILELNDAVEHQTSPMVLEKLKSLDRMSCYHKVVVKDGLITAFLLAMPEGAPYQSDNYSWFSSRFEQFVYVDRIVVDSRFAGNRIGSMLYEDLFAFAQSKGVDDITCEYNIKPLNIISRAFHEKFGFKQIGTQWNANRSKLVSMQVAKT